MQLRHYSQFLCFLALAHCEDLPFLLLVSSTVNINVEESRPNCITGRFSFLHLIQILSGGESCGDLGFFLNKSRKFGKMLSMDQVQMVASNQQAAGVFSTAAESHPSVPSPVIG